MCALVTGVQTCALPICAVDLYTIDGKFFQPRQIGITRTEIVDSDTYALLPQSADLHQHFVIHFNGQRFGDLPLKLRSRNAVTLHEVGRASCRESVGWYGEIPWVAVCIKKKTQRQITVTYT